MKKVLLVLLLCLTLQSVAVARYCNSPYCAMCNRLFGPMEGYEIINGRVVRIQEVVVQPEPEPEPEVKLNYEPTPQEAVDAMLKLVNPKEGETLYDLGCGDGRILITAAKQYKCLGVGIELDPDIAKYAKSEIEKADVDERVIVVEGDLLDYKLNKADIITLYLFPDLIEQIVPRIMPGTRVVSFCHPIGDDSTEHVIIIDEKEYIFYTWTVPYVY